MEQQQQTERPTNPRRRRRTKMQILKEVYLPVWIAGATAILLVILIIGSIVRGVQRGQYNKQLRQEAAIAAQQAQEQQDAEVEYILAESADMASHFDYRGAMDLIASFSGDSTSYPMLQTKYDEYSAAADQLVAWDNPADVLSLSFQMLVADPQRAYVDESYGVSYRENFVTVSEFQGILEQLYANGYILVSIDDIAIDSEPTTLYLPQGKKPLLLTQTNVNYYTYMTDGDGDRLPDKDGAGFASRLVFDANGNVTAEYITAQGETVTGPYDLVPILEAFVQTHPDFSYKKAKAVLAVSAYDGILGYRTAPSAETYFGADFRAVEIESATAMVQALKDLGYVFANYTYENEPYGSFTAEQIAQELDKWESEVTPILGQLDLFVFSRNSDLAEPETGYNDTRFDTIREHGYTRYLGFSGSAQGWCYAGSNYFRMGRTLVTGSALTENTLFTGIFDGASILDPARSTPES